jgi:recombination protein RecT
MSEQKLANKKPETITQLLKAYNSQIAAALPRHLDADRMSRVALTEIRRNPKLMACNPISLFGAIIQASQLGLEIGSGGAHLVPYGKEVQMIPDYRGLMSIARRSGDINVIYAQIVHENDTFDYQFGTQYFLHFKPAKTTRGKIIGCFAIANFKDGASQFEYMTVDDIDDIRQRSKAKDKGPWVTDYEAMAKKTVLRQLCKFLPASIELQRAVTLDELNDSDISQNNKAIIDAEFSEEYLPVEGKPEVEMPTAVQQ